MDIFDKQQAVCEYCENHIIEGGSSSTTFLCEGRFCEEAEEAYDEYIEDNKPSIDEYSII